MRIYSGNPNNWVDSVPIPTDGDKMNERNFAPAWEKNADRSAYLKRIMPRMYSYGGVPQAPGYPNTPNALWTYGNSGAQETTVAAGILVNVPDCTVGDKIHVVGYVMFHRAGAETKAFDLYADAVDRVNGTPGTQTHIPGAVWSTTTGIDAGQEARPFPVCLSGVWTVALAGTTRVFFAFNGPTFSGGSADVTYIWEASIAAIRYPVLTL